MGAHCDLEWTLNLVLEIKIGIVPTHAVVVSNLRVVTGEKYVDDVERFEKKLQSRESKSKATYNSLQGSGAPSRYLPYGHLLTLP